MPMKDDLLLKEIQERRGYFESLAKENPDFQKVLVMADLFQQALQLLQKPDYFPEIQYQINTSVYKLNE